MKKYLITLSTVGLLFVCSNTLADRDPPGPGPSPFDAMLSELKNIATSISSLPSQIASGMGQGFGALEKYIGQLYAQGNTWEINQNYQPIPHLKDTQTLNTVQITSEGNNYTPQEATNTIASVNTEDNLYNTMMYSTYNMYQKNIPIKNDFHAADKSAFSDYVTDNSAFSLANIPGFDSLYVLDPQSKVDMITVLQKNGQQYKPLLEKPDALNSNYLNFGAFLTPVVYTTQQLKDAKNFLKFAGQSTADISGGINFQLLYGNPNALLQLKMNPIYQNYVLTTRSMLAQRSVLLNTFNQFIAERTPIKGLGSASGLSTPDASPLQVEQYQATHRVRDPHWYDSIENAAPATIQRNILILLTEIEAQNYQAHLDREQMLSVMANMGLSGITQSIQTSLTQQQQTMNQTIDTILHPNKQKPSSENTSKQLSSQLDKNKEENEKKKQ